MSGLLYICEYGNDSESDDCEIDNSISETKSKLPLPDLSSIPAVLIDQHSDNPELHKGRVRSFPHVRGNWATFIYIKYPQEASLLILAKKLKTLLNLKDSGHLCDDFHLSLSKTIVLNYHSIIPFTQSLQEALRDTKSFYLAFNSFGVFCNSEKTCTFIVLKADFFSNKSLSDVINKIDVVLEEFKLEKFYEDPSFHISLLWIKGDHRAELEVVLDNLSEILCQEIVSSIQPVLINKVNCKSGNKYFQYSLE